MDCTGTEIIILRPTIPSYSTALYCCFGFANSVHSKEAKSSPRISEAKLHSARPAFLGCRLEGSWLRFHGLQSLQLRFQAVLINISLKEGLYTSGFDKRKQASPANSRIDTEIKINTKDTRARTRTLTFPGVFLHS